MVLTMELPYTDDGRPYVYTYPLQEPVKQEPTFSRIMGGVFFANMLSGLVFYITYMLL